MFSLDTAIKYLSLGGFLMIFLSSLKLTLYYSFFDINIGEYIQLNEYIVQFIYDLYYYILILGIGIFLHIFSEVKYRGQNERIKLLIEDLEAKKKDAEKNNQQGAVDEYEVRLKKLRKENVNKWALIVIFLLVLIGFGISFFYPSLPLSRRYSLVFLSLAFGVFLLNIWLTRTKYEINQTFFQAMILLVLMMYNSIIEPQQIKENQPKFDIYLSFNDGKELESSTSLKYIGKTEKFVFFYNLETTKTNIYSLDGLSKIEIKKIDKTNQKKE